MNIERIHHVAYRCKDARQTVEWYGKYLNMGFILAIAEDQVPSTRQADPYMHVFLDAGQGNVLAFFEIPNSPPMGRDANTPAWVQHLAFKVDSEATLKEVMQRLQTFGTPAALPVNLASTAAKAGTSGKTVANADTPTDCETARRSAIALVTSEGPKIRRAEEGDDLVLVRRRVQRIVHAEACEPGLGRQLAERGVLAEIEHRGAVEDRAHARVAHLEQVHAPIEVEATMEELHFEHRLTPPDRVGRAVADVTVLVVTEVRNCLGQLRGAIRIGLGGPVARDLVDGCEGEWRRRRRGLRTDPPPRRFGQQDGRNHGE